MPNKGSPRLASSNVPGSDAPRPQSVVSVSWDARAVVGAAQLTVFLAVRPSGAGSVRAVARVCGEIDIANVTELHAAALAVVGAAHPQPGQQTLLVLDLEEVTFLGCRALHFLQDICAQGIERGWVVELRVPRAAGPYRVLCLASSHGWLPPGLVPAPHPTGSATPKRPAPHAGRWLSRRTRSAA